MHSASVVSVISIGKVQGLAFSGVAAFCLSIGVPVAWVSPASAERFNPFGYYEVKRTQAQHDRKRHKAKRNETKSNDLQFKQSIPPGPVHVVVSIARQRAILFSNGVRVAEGPISTGVPHHPTPTGVFSVIGKSRYHRSNIYSGAPMPYMQRITWSGVALHQGPLPGFPASHGCIRLTQAFAAKLWGITKIGTRVIVTRAEVSPALIESDRLLVPKKPEEKPIEEKPADAVAAPAPAPVMAATTAVVAENAASPDAVKQSDAPSPVTAPPPPPKPKGPVEVFVSRKAAKVYVKQGFTPLFEAPVAIAEPDKPWGTHVFTVMDVKDDKATWTVLSIPSGYARKASGPSRKLSAKEAREFERQQKHATAAVEAPTAAQALERFELPQDAADRISELLVAGSALIVSDNKLSNETGPHTGFIVATH